MEMTVKYFDDNGRRIPGEGARVFGSDPSFYYKLNQPEIEYELILNRIKQFSFQEVNATPSAFKAEAEALLEKIKDSEAYSGLLKGIKVPFVIGKKARSLDLGEELEIDLLPSLQKSFNAQFPESHFKAVLQSNSELRGNITLAAGSRYQELISATESGSVVGWYFPQALQEFDVRSQRDQMASLPEIQGAKICLSGGIDICAAVSGVPDLLISDEFYTPILCMSAYTHGDPRLVLLLKAYGPHMEFWCMTQMLTPDTTQVSEQWAGGITIFSAVI
jgi:hypothetical protein